MNATNLRFQIHFFVSIFISPWLALCNTMSSTVLSPYYSLFPTLFLTLSPNPYGEVWQGTVHCKREVCNTFLATNSLPGNITHHHIGPELLVWLSAFPQSPITVHRGKVSPLNNNVNITTNNDKSYITANYLSFTGCEIFNIVQIFIVLIGILGRCGLQIMFSSFFYLIPIFWIFHRH